MRRIALLLAALTALSLVCEAKGTAKQTWPDGTPMDKWFSREPKGPSGKEARRFSVLDFGAMPGEEALQTEAIQRTIDAAAAAGGGTVVVPTGWYRTGALFFKPHTHLYLCPDAVLKGSQDIRDYPDAEVHIEGVLQPYPAALINAYGVDGFSITGEGIIDGEGAPFWDAFWARRKESPACTNLEVRRPRLVYICNSRDVLIEGNEFLNPGFWNIHLYKCSHVRVRDTRISAPKYPVKAPSSDGIDLDACTDVHISGTEIQAGDDLIAIKGGKGPHADRESANGTNARILVENCDFGYGPGVLVFGSECVGARNVILRDCQVTGNDRLVWLKMRPDTPQRYEYILVERVGGDVGSVIYAKPWTQFFDLKGEKEIPKSYASHITVRDCNLRCYQLRRIEEAPDQYELSDISTGGNKLKFLFNKEENKIKAYTLEDPLTFADGRKVSAASQWPERRQEILSLFQREMYGQMPAPSKIYLETLEEGYSIEKSAVRRQVRMRFSPDGKGPKIDWLIVMPRYAKGPVPVILTLNYYGNHTVLPDGEILLPDYPQDEPLKERGVLSRTGGRTIYPVDMLLARGYAFVTACYEDVSPDPDPIQQESDAYHRIFDLWGPRDPARKDNTTSLAAWAWALQRGVDMIGEMPELDASRIVLTGSSRLGKAALLASAFDARFAVTVINQSGGGGVPLSKRNFGETVASEVIKFPHWFCRAYDKYAGEEKKMPFDQHLLLSCIAPRPLLIEGFNNPWFDTYGEFLSLKAASPVWEFLGAPGLPDVAWPEENATDAVGRTLGYVRRHGSHGISAQDWTWTLDFAGHALCPGHAK